MLMDCREECAALRRENRLLLRRIEEIHELVTAEKLRADLAESILAQLEKRAA